MCGRKEQTSKKAENYFDSEDDALEYAIHNQRDRRNLTDAEFVSALSVYDKRKQRGGDHGNQYTKQTLPKASDEAIAKPQHTHHITTLITIRTTNTTIG